jgi:ABC-type multidrug transport system fused ATPase/permease subunit
MSRSSLRLELTFLKRHKALFAATLFWRGVWELAPMQVPLLAGVIVDGLTGKGLRLFGLEWPDSSPQEVLQFAALGFFAVASLYGLSAYVYTVTGARLDKRFVLELRKAVVEKVMFLSLDHHQRHGSGALLDRALRDTDRLRGFTERIFTRTITNAVRAVYPIAMLFVINPLLAIIALAVVPPQWLVVWYLNKRLHAATRKSLASHTDLAAAVQENLDGVETVKGLNAEASSVAKLHDQADRVEADELATARLSALVRCTTWLLTGVGIALVWWQGSSRVLASEMTLGALVAFTGFAELGYRPFRRFTDLVKTYRSGMASLERVQELLDTPSSVRVHNDARPIEVNEGHIALREVSFAYAEQVVLKNLNLEIAPRELTAVVGPSGAGKSSLLRLIARLYDPKSGQVLIDGQPLETATLDSLRSRLVVVPQRPVIFSGTVLENVRLAKPDASLDEARSACESASALGFIERLKHGFDTQLGRHGVNLSAGEIQRIAIARALLTRPRILLMDEPTAALDAGSEAAIVKALRGLRGEMTVVVVGHRAEVVRHADRVIVLDAGCVVAEGAHEELLLRSPLYQKLFGGSNRDVNARDIT